MLQLLSTDLPSLVPSVWPQKQSVWKTPKRGEAQLEAHRSRLMDSLEATFRKVGKPLAEDKHPRYLNGPTLRGRDGTAGMGRLEGTGCDEILPTIEGFPVEAGMPECRPDEAGLTNVVGSAEAGATPEGLPDDTNAPKGADWADGTLAPDWIDSGPLERRAAGAEPLKDAEREALMVPEEPDIDRAEASVGAEEPKDASLDDAVCGVASVLEGTEVFDQ